MAQFKAFSPNVTVRGQAILAVLDAMGTYKTTGMQILEKNGISNLHPDQFYSQQAWLNVLKQIYEQIGPNTLFSIGKKIPEYAAFPPDIDSLEKALASIDMAYKMNHKGGLIGNYKYQKTGDKMATLVCDNPYPCDFDRGLILAMATKFRPLGSRVVVEHNDSQPCRKKGGQSCTYVVRW